MRVIAGIARSLPLKSVPGTDTRPTTDRIKETLFNMLNPYLSGASFLDLFAGTGGIGIEALSRGASDATFVENSRVAVQVIEDNLTFTKLKEHATVLPADVFSALKRLEASRKAPFDIIFMDPPYGQGLEKQVLSLLKDSTLVSEDTLIIYEAKVEDSVEDIPSLGFQVYKEKKYTTNKHVWVTK